MPLCTITLWLLSGRFRLPRDAGRNLNGKYADKPEGIQQKIAASNDRASCSVANARYSSYDCYMSFLAWPTEEVLPSRRAQQHRRCVVSALLKIFNQAFPELTYELLWESPTINAQAWRLGPARFVRVYGGLVRHPAITKYGLALTLAHETGHHLGGLPRDPAMPWLTWQGQADYWAASVGMPRIWGGRAKAATLRGARELLELHGAFEKQLDDDEPDLSAECRYRIWRAGALGRQMPDCAMPEFASILNDERRVF
jgi:hypothetical protein